MSKTIKAIKAIYENGVLRPLEPVELAEGTQVTIDISEKLTEEEIQRRLDSLRQLVDAFADMEEKEWQEFDEAVKRLSYWIFKMGYICFFALSCRLRKLAKKFGEAC